MGTDSRTIEALANREYKWGFVTEIDADAAPKGLNEDIIRLISTKKNEPEFMGLLLQRWTKKSRQGGLLSSLRLHRGAKPRRWNPCLARQDRINPGGTAAGAKGAVDRWHTLSLNLASAQKIPPVWTYVR